MTPPSDRPSAPRLSEEERAADAVWSEYEALLDADQEGCPHTEPGDPLHCWHCRQQTFRLVARKHLGAVLVTLREAEARAEKLREAITVTLNKEMLGEGLHTAFRKASDSERAHRIWQLIAEMPDEEWAEIAQFAVYYLGTALGEQP